MKNELLGDYVPCAALPQTVQIGSFVYSPFSLFLLSIILLSFSFGSFMEHFLL
jgi:hypothetical protein